MPDLVAIAYLNRQAAVDGRLALMRVAPDRLEDFGDAIVADVDSYGSIDLDQLVNLWSLGHKGSMLRTLLAGLLFLHPLLEVLPGEVPDIITTAMRAFGLDDDFMIRVRQMLTPGHAVVFLLASPAAVALAKLDATGIAEQPVTPSKFDMLASAFTMGREAAIHQRATVYSRNEGDDPLR
jgi:uncharacterized membrane protein